MTYVIPNDGTVFPDGPSNKPLAKGKYQATILPTGKDSREIVKRPAAKQGINAALHVQAVRFRISDGQTGAGRNVFADIPLFRKWAATGKGQFPDGTPAFLFAQFWKALGYDIDAPEGFALPEDEVILGKSVELVLDIEPANGDYPERNRVQFINAAGAAAPAAGAAPASAWATPAANAAVQAAPINWGQPAAPVVPAVAGLAPAVWNPAADVAAAQQLVGAGAPAGAKGF